MTLQRQILGVCGTRTGPQIDPKIAQSVGLLLELGKSCE